LSFDLVTRNYDVLNVDCLYFKVLWLYWFGLCISAACGASIVANTVRVSSN
jgi:hypothetical protein